MIYIVLAICIPVITLVWMRYEMSLNLFMDETDYDASQVPDVCKVQSGVPGENQSLAVECHAEMAGQT